MTRMDIALCYPSVLPSRGGCETYITDLARRLARDGHRVHIYASTWDASALPPSTHFHRVPTPRRPRFLRPWRFAAACEKALKSQHHDVSIGFDKTWGQDVLYPQGGLHAATRRHNLLKFQRPITRVIAAVGKWLDPADWSFRLLERRQYLGPYRPKVIVNSRMVRQHVEQYLGIQAEDVRIVRSAIDPMRFAADDRPRRRAEERDRWGVTPETTVGLFVAMNYRLKGLEPLLRSLTKVSRQSNFVLAVVGHRKNQEFVRQAERLGIADRVRFLGFRADPKDAYFAADFLVHPTFYDPCSLVVLESLACGLPVVTSRYNGAAELLTDTTGVVVDDPHDATEMAAAIERMTCSRFRATAATAAREAARGWTFDQHYRDLMAVFEEIRGLKRAA